MFCVSCGSKIDNENKFCSGCGVQVNEQVHVAPSPPYIGDGTRDQGRDVGFVYSKNPPRSVGWMAFASLMIPGLGQILCGQTGKGWLLLVVGYIIYFASGGLLGIPVSLLSCFDAMAVAGILKREGKVKQWAWFPKATDS